VYELIHNRTVFPSYDNLATANNCTVMHVRRGDAGLAAPPYRRYAAVSEYIEAARIGRGETILLLTDDESTLAEIAEFHADDYDWVYARRPRVNLTQGGFSGHTPSNDGAFEFTLMEAEFELGTCVRPRSPPNEFVLIFRTRLTLPLLPTTDSTCEAKKCDKLVAGQSSFANLIADRMETSVEVFKIDQSAPAVETHNFTDATRGIFMLEEIWNNEREKQRRRNSTTAHRRALYLYSKILFLSHPADPRLETVGQSPAMASY